MEQLTLVKLKKYSEDDLTKLLNKLTKNLDENAKGTDTLQLLRTLFLLVSMRCGEFHIPDDVVQKLFNVLEEEKTSLRIRVLCAFILNHVPISNYPIFKENLRQQKKNYLTLVLPLLLCFGTQDFLSTNLSNLIMWASSEDYQLHNVTLPLLTHIVRRAPSIFSYQKHIKILETQMVKWLLNASTVSAKQSAAANLLLKLNISKPLPVTELDDSVARDFFTVLNNSKLYTEDQIFNVYTFSMLYTWLHYLYCTTTTSRNSDKSDKTSEQMATQMNIDNDLTRESQQTGTLKETATIFKLDSEFQETIVKYCLRVIEQSKAKLLPTDVTSEKSTSSSNRDLADAALIECIRILDLLCKSDTALIARLFPTMKKLFNIANTRVASETELSSQPANVSAVIDKYGGHIDLALLQFFLNHSEAVVYDPEPLFRNFFQNFIGNNYKNSFLAFETLHFCRKNKKSLLFNTHVFSQYFPLLLKLWLWHPYELLKEIEDLLPCFVSPSTFLELFHLLLDLPLVVAALERSDVDNNNEDKDSAKGGFESGPTTSASFSSPFNSPSPYSASSKATSPFYLATLFQTPTKGITSPPTTHPLNSPLSSRTSSMASYPVLPSIVMAGFSTGNNNLSLETSIEDVKNRYRVLYNCLLRNESGVAINLWDPSTTRAIVQNFCKELDVPTPRLLAVAEHTPKLTALYFDILTAYAEEKHLLEIVPIIFERTDQLFPLPSYQNEIRKLLVDKVLAIFQKCPSFVVTFQKQIIEMFRDISMNTSREELVLHLCWAIGEYTKFDPVTNPNCTPQVLYEYDEALELLAFERMSLASMTPAKSSKPNLTPTPVAEELGDSPQAQYNNRLMLVVITALSKLAARWQPLCSRVMLCLYKIFRYENHFHSTVIQYARECLNLLKMSSIASAIVDVKHNTELSTHHVDNKSSLAFLLRPVGEYIPGRKITEFEET